MSPGAVDWRTKTRGRGLVRGLVGKGEEGKGTIFVADGFADCD